MAGDILSALPEAFGRLDAAPAENETGVPVDLW
jgi:hypothetical protein